MYQVHKIFRIMMVTLCVCPMYTHALETDHNEKVNIIADSWVYNFKSGMNVYEGNVKVDQGSTHITADRLVTKNNAQHKIKEATAFGLENLAHYWTLPKEGDVEIHAKAKVIKYYPIETNVTLEKTVQVTQGENTFQGELIHYNSKDQTITVPATKNARAIIVYNPDK